MFFEFNDISYSYGQSIALDSLSFFAPRGEIVGLIGENGAGKTTAVKTIVRFIKPEHGTISINETDIQKIKLEQYPVPIFQIHRCFMRSFLFWNTYNLLRHSFRIFR